MTRAVLGCGRVIIILTVRNAIDHGAIKLLVALPGGARWARCGVGRTNPPSTTSAMTVARINRAAQGGQLEKYVNGAPAETSRFYKHSSGRGEIETSQS